MQPKPCNLIIWYVASQCLAGVFFALIFALESIGIGLEAMNSDFAVVSATHCASKAEGTTRGSGQLCALLFVFGLASKMLSFEVTAHFE